MLSAFVVALKAKQERDKTRQVVSKAGEEGDKVKADLNTASDKLAETVAKAQGEMDANKAKVDGLTPEEKVVLGNKLLGGDIEEEENTEK
jgi:lipid II:glycine glycyltransferase (peptidoglycan interpeptide bridge formation enzyme)